MWSGADRRRPTIPNALPLSRPGTELGLIPIDLRSGRATVRARFSPARGLHQRLRRGHAHSDFCRRVGDFMERKAKPWYAKLYYQVIIAIAVGILLGHFSPAYAVKLKPLGDAFIALIKMMILPIIFCNVVYGIA